MLPSLEQAGTNAFKVYWYLIFPDSSPAISIFWQLLSGMSLLNASIFAATFFKGPKISSIFVCICFCCLAGGAAVLLNRHVDTGRVVFLSLLFPSMNYIFTLGQMAAFPRVKLPINMLTSGATPLSTSNASLRPIHDDSALVYNVAIWVFWVLLVVQIITDPVLAILVERAIHGVNTKGRTLTATEDPERPNVAVRVTGLSKVYTTWWE